MPLSALCACMVFSRRYNQLSRASLCAVCKNGMLQPPLGCLSLHIVPLHFVQVWYHQEAATASRVPSAKTLCTSMVHYVQVWCKYVQVWYFQEAATTSRVPLSALCVHVWYCVLRALSKYTMCKVTSMAYESRIDSTRAYVL